MVKIFVTRMLSTSLAIFLVDKVAAEAGVNITHTETRLAGKGKWINEFEIVGPPGKVDAFFERIEDLRHDLT